MTHLMKAVRFHGKGDLRFEDIPIPAVDKGKVKVIAKLLHGRPIVGELMIDLAIGTTSMGGNLRN
jgi:hypothetical protein